MCLRVTVRQAPQQLGFCNRYFDGYSPYEDLSKAFGMIDSYAFGPLGIRRASVTLGITPDVEEAFIRSVRGPRRVRPGQRITLTLNLQRRRAGRFTMRVPYRVPRSLRPGRRTLTVRGIVPGSGDMDAGDIFELLFGGGGGAQRPPRSVVELAGRIKTLGGTEGIRATFGSEGRGPVVHRTGDLLVRGRAEIAFQVRKPGN